MSNFTELFAKYGKFTDKERLHHNGYLYDRWLGNQAVRSVLELGATNMGGGGLLSFAEKYPGACVLGVDRTDRNLCEQAKSTPNIKMVIGDVYNAETVQKVTNVSASFDLIVEDCIHKKNHQFVAFELWSPLLSPGGLYIIEDVFEHEALDLLSRLSIYNKEWQILFGDTRHLQMRYGQIPDIMLGLQRYGG